MLLFYTGAALFRLSDLLHSVERTFATLTCLPVSTPCTRATSGAGAAGLVFAASWACGLGLLGLSWAVPQGGPWQEPLSSLCLCSIHLLARSGLDQLLVLPHQFCIHLPARPVGLQAGLSSLYEVPMLGT